MNQSQRRPYRMVAAQDKTVVGAAQYRLDAAPIGFNPRCIRIVKAPSVYGAPKIGVEFEVGAAPLPAHRAKDQLEVFLSLRMCPVQRIPRTSPPTAEGH